MFTIEGEANLPPRQQPCVIVANHASYLDGAIVPNDRWKRQLYAEGEVQELLRVISVSIRGN